MMSNTQVARVVGLGIVLLFFLQLLADFIEHVYVFGLLGTSIPVEIVALLFLLTPWLLLLRRRPLPRWTLFLLLGLVMLARVVEPNLPTRGRMLLSGAGVGAFLLWLPGILQARLHRQPVAHWALSAYLAVVFSALFRTSGLGLDLTTLGMGQVIGWVFVVTAAWGLWRDRESAQSTGSDAPAGGGIVLPGVSLFAVVALLYFVFSAPHVLARWSGIDYRQIIMLYALSWALALLLWVRQVRLSPMLLELGNTVLVLALALAAWLQQTPLPADPHAYPLFAVETGWMQALPLFVSIVLSPLLAIDFAVLVGRVQAAGAPLRRWGIGFGLGSLMLLCLILAHVFTTVYDYIPVIGPLFRDQFWLVHLVAGLLVLPGLFQQQAVLTPLRPRLATILLGAAFILLIEGVGLNAPPKAPADVPATLTVQTYNIQQGYSETGQRNFDGQLAILQTIDADLIGLQESDNARIAGGNADVVRYFAHSLGRYAYYGPKTVTGTFGIALLSRYPILNPRTAFLYSEGEQVAVILADVQTTSGPVHVMVTHLGNGGPLIQQEQLLRLVPENGPVIAMGDFNFRPYEAQYLLTTHLLQDSWTLRWPTWRDDAGNEPTTKIDHIFVSPGTQVLDARWLVSPASDHPSIMATLRW